MAKSQDSTNYVLKRGAKRGYVKNLYFSRAAYRKNSTFGA